MIKIELSKLLINLRDGHFADILVKINFFFLKNRIGVLFPNFLNQVKSSIHLIVIRLDFFESLNCLDLKAPGSSFKRCSIEIVSDSEANEKDLFESLVLFQ